MADQPLLRLSGRHHAAIRLHGAAAALAAGDRRVSRHDLPRSQLRLRARHAVRGFPGPDAGPPFVAPCPQRRGTRERPDADAVRRALRAVRVRSARAAARLRPGRERRGADDADGRAAAADRSDRPARARAPAQGVCGRGRPPGRHRDGVVRPGHPRPRRPHRRRAREGPGQPRGRPRAVPRTVGLFRLLAEPGGKPCPLRRRLGEHR